MSETAHALPVIASYEDEMRDRYTAYAMAVIVARALPDVRDGMKPVHRRILYGMLDGGYTHDKPYRKSARIVGDVMGKFHPHGDASIYDAMVRMAQPFKLTLPLVDGQGNFGSVDGDPPAAMRYTEVRLSRLAVEGFCEDLKRGSLDLRCVDFMDNYDQSEKEPTVFPSRFPNLIVTGGEGIAVGMATKVPPHNLSEVIDATLAVIANPSADIDDVLLHMKGPDFPTGGVLMGRGAIREAYKTGRGSVTLVGTHVIEEMKNGRQQIVLTSLPYDVNKAFLIEAIAALAREKDLTRNNIEGLSDIRDETTNKDGTRVVIELKRDVDPNVVLERLKRFTKFQTSCSFNMVCLLGGRKPMTMGILQMIQEWIAFRRTTIERRTETLLNDSQRKLHIQVALYAASSAIEEVIKRIRAAKDQQGARAALMAIDFDCGGEFAVLVQAADPDQAPSPVFKLTEDQAREVLSLRLSSLTALDQQDTARKANEYLSAIRGYQAILNDRSCLDDLMCSELAAIKAQFAQPRRTRVESADANDIAEEDMVENTPVVITLTNQAYVKRTPRDAYREQRRGGAGKMGMDTKDEDFVVRTIVTMARTQLLFITTGGQAHIQRAFRMPEGAPNTRGRPLVNWVPLNPGEGVAAILPIPATAEEVDGMSMVFVTSRGEVRRNDARDFMRVNKNGKLAMRLPEDREGEPPVRLVDVLLCGPDSDIVLASRKGRAVRFALEDVRTVQSRESTGVAGIRLAADDVLVGASVLKHSDASPRDRDAWFAGGTANYKDEAGEDREHTLGAAGMAAMAASEEFVLTVSEQGYGKRFSSHGFRVSGRGVQGVSSGTFNEKTGDQVACIPVTENDGLILATDGGKVIRTRVAEVNKAGRDTRGVRLFGVPEGDRIVSVARVPAED